MFPDYFFLLIVNQFQHLHNNNNNNSSKNIFDQNMFCIDILSIICFNAQLQLLAKRFCTCCPSPSFGTRCNMLHDKAYAQHNVAN